MFLFPIFYIFVKNFANLTRFSFISVILLFTYSVSAFMGIGIFSCSCTHSQQLVMMSVHPSCQCSNSVENCCRHNEHHSDDEEDDDCGDDCCSLVFQYMDVDQLNITKSLNQPTKVLSFLFSPLSIDGLITSIKECTVAVKNNSPPFGLFKIPLIYMYGQLRL